MSSNNNNDQPSLQSVVSASDPDFLSRHNIFGFDNVSDNAFRLENRLYGVRQAPICWYKVPMNMGFAANNVENGTYFKSSGGKLAIVAVGLFVDDLLYITNDAKLLQDTNRRRGLKLNLGQHRQIPLCGNQTEPKA
ncbi:hypothetical protein TRICI_002500 [Trichomonascus ciferrii]|uniref:Reverse transcriptase Ty1/copia-type domain-containing protein n=1 Tax=Trichomonascus ciferrii TaxID=44093 RepID=A0A642V6L7_9ASCO|nr:hypothetical protein TRICI_002500 [Trichomonascus ciferrii]